MNAVKQFHPEQIISALLRAENIARTIVKTRLIKKATNSFGDRFLRFLIVITDKFSNIVLITFVDS